MIGTINNIKTNMFFIMDSIIILVKSNAWLASAIVWNENGIENNAKNIYWKMKYIDKLIVVMKVIILFAFSFNIELSNVNNIIIGILNKTVYSKFIQFTTFTTTLEKNIKAFITFVY